MAKIDRDVETQRALTEVKSLKIRAEGEGKALIVDAQARAAEISILAKAEYVISLRLLCRCCCGVVAYSDCILSRLSTPQVEPYSRHRQGFGWH